MMRLAICLAVAAVFGGGDASAQSDNAGLYLYLIPTAPAPDAQRLHDGAILADLVVPDPAFLARQLAAVSNLTVVEATDTHVRVIADAADTTKGGPVADYLANSFVIDYREPSVEVLVDQVTERYGPQPTVDDLVVFVDRAISSKSLRRGFDLASQVAEHGEGDCTEHAVLLAAVARALKLPARVVFGVQLIEHSGNLQSFGHAWTEIHDGERWRIADATRPDHRQPGSRIRYLPLRPLDDEGPGYAMQLMQLAVTQPSRIERIENAVEP